jgi:hypothetical protein
LDDALVFVEYGKPGNYITLDLQQGAIRSLGVKTYLDEAPYAVSLSVNIQKLPADANHVADLAMHPWQTSVRGRGSAAVPSFLH